MSDFAGALFPLHSPVSTLQVTLLLSFGEGREHSGQDRLPVHKS